MEKLLNLPIGELEAIPDSEVDAHFKKYMTIVRPQLQLRTRQVKTVADKAKLNKEQVFAETQKMLAYAKQLQQGNKP